MRRRGEKFPVLFKSGGNPRFHSFVFDVDQQWNKGAEWVQNYLVWPQGWKDSP